MNLSKILCCICCLLSTGEVLGMISNSEEDENKNSSKNPENLNNEAPITYKVVLVGDAGVGKTQIMEQYGKKNFNTEYENTIGVDFIEKNLSAQEKGIKLKIWYTAGQEKYKSLIPTYLREAHAIVFVYDITKQESFDNIQNWLNFVQQGSNKKNNIENGNDIINEENEKKTPLYFLVGNKTDLEEKRAVSYEEGKNFAEEKEMQFFEVSAKEGKKIDDLFEDIIIKCLGKFDGINDVLKSDIKILKYEKDYNINDINYINYSNYNNNKNNNGTKYTNGNEESCWKNCFRSCCNKLGFWRNNKNKEELILTKTLNSEESFQNEDNNDNTTTILIK